MNLLLPGFLGPSWPHDAGVAGAGTAPPGAAAAGYSTTGYAVPSGITRTSSSTAISNAPREQRTTSSLPLSSVTFATVGSSLRGLNAAVPACSTNAFDPAVENAAVPPVNVALGEPSSVPQTKRLEPVITNRSAPARTCRLPRRSVSSLSPANTVAPTEAAALPTCARSADTTVPKPQPDAPHLVVSSRLLASAVARLTAVRPRQRIL